MWGPSANRAGGPHQWPSLGKSFTLNVSIANPTAPVRLPKRSARRKVRNDRRVYAGIVVLILGAVAVVYPVVATLISNYSQNQAIEANQRQLQSQPSDVIERELEKAHRYNKHLVSGPIYDPFLDKVVPDAPEYLSYKELLALTGQMGEITIPKIGVRLPVYHGTEESTLTRGAGHLFGSSLPVGGDSTHAVVTAHSGLANATMFDHLRQVGKGDVFYLSVLGKTLAYEVKATQVVRPEDTDSLLVQPGQDMVTLITCTPYGVNSHRLLVHGYRTELTKAHQAELEQAKPAIWQSWMYLPFVLLLGVVAYLLWRILRQRKYLPKHGSTADNTQPETETSSRQEPKDDSGETQLR